MTETASPETVPKPRGSTRLLAAALVLSLALGAGGFYAAYSGLLPVPGVSGGVGPARLPDIAFVPIEPLVVTLGPEARSRHLRFSAQVEVARAHQSEVALLMPRVVDVLNGYLRAVELSDLEDPAALIRLRAQMLRRIQMVTGEGRVRDLLIAEFVLN
ncbi:MAG: flagellar basal body-associated protein FliL [Gemmobacter sp.]